MEVSICAVPPTSTTIPLPVVVGVGSTFTTNMTPATRAENHKKKQEAQGLGALLDKMEDNDHINWITQRSRCIFHPKTCRFRDTKLKI